MGKFATFVFGGLVGAAAALMLSPRTGEENRQVVIEKFNESCPGGAAQIQDKAGVLVGNVASTSTKVINTVVDKGQDIYNNITRSQGLSDASPEAFAEKNDDLRQKIDAARERIATQVAKNAEAVHDAAVDKAPAVVDAASSAAGAAKEAISGATGAVKGAAGAAKDAVSSAASSVTSK